MWLYTLLKEWQYRRRRRDYSSWKANAIQLVINEILPDNCPYQYDVVLSFLQVEGFDIKDPIRLDLFLPDYPLAIDFVGPQHSSSYTPAAYYINKEEWEKYQERFSIKKQLFSSYGCHYMTLSYDEAFDSRSISEKIREALGYYLE